MVSQTMCTALVILHLQGFALVFTGLRHLLLLTPTMISI